MEGLELDNHRPGTPQSDPEKNKRAISDVTQPNPRGLSWSEHGLVDGQHEAALRGNSWSSRHLDQQATLIVIFDCKVYRRLQRMLLLVINQGTVQRLNCPVQQQWGRQHVFNMSAAFRQGPWAWNRTTETKQSVRNKWLAILEDWVREREGERDPQKVLFVGVFLLVCFFCGWGGPAFLCFLWGWGVFWGFEMDWRDKSVCWVGLLLNLLVSVKTYSC